MISYELAKQLKEVGFPQEKSELYYINDISQIETKDSRYGGSWHVEEDMDLICAIPTLSELTNECFKIDKGLSVDINLKEDRYYVVFNTQDKHGNYLDYLCPSLEEAFAMEWLELNKTNLQKIFSPEALEIAEPLTDGGELDNFGIK